MGIDKSNPFSRLSDEDIQKFEYGAGGRNITFQDIPGVKEGKAVSDKEIGAAGSGAPVT